MAVNGARYLASRPNEHVTYLLRPPEKRPRSGVNALAVAPSSSSVSLFAGGRDGIVRSWDETATSGATAIFNEHADWVNDVLLVHHGERLLSASSDTTIKVWNPADPRESLRTLVEHDDYVKALAPLSDTAVVSAALDGRVLVWDLVTGKVRGECGEEPESPATALGAGFGAGIVGGGAGGGGGSAGGGGVNRSSVYCLASCVDPQAALIVSGSTDRAISVFDARSRGSIVRLRGHTDAIRSLTLKHDGTMLLSGSSDATVRLWDLRQQRCVRAFDSHQTDSVWALDAPRAFESFISGGRDGTVWHSSLAGDCASLVSAVTDARPREGMVLDVKLVREDERRVWVSTTGSTVRQWKVPAVDAPSAVARNDRYSSRSQERLANGREAANGMDPMDFEAAAARGVLPENSPQPDLVAGLRSPLIELKGLPATIAYKVMNDRRHVMTLDTDDDVCLWDVTSASFVKSLGRKPSDVEFEDMAEEHNPIVAVPSWFKVDIRRGSPAVRLSRSSVSEAEVYAVDIGLDVESDESKINIGDHVVRGLFSQWKAKTDDSGTDNSLEAADGYGRGASEGSRGRGADSAANGSAASRKPMLPPYVFPEETPIIFMDDSPIPIMTRTAGNFDGSDKEYEAVPLWVHKVVREGKSMAREGGPPKIGFSLHPVEGSGLPELKTTSLTAPQVLRVRKVTAYVAKELSEQFGAEKLHEDLEAKHFEILCCGKPCAPTMNLATVKKFMWQVEASGDFELAFRMQEMDSPTPMSASVAAAAAAIAASAKSSAQNLRI